MSVKSVVSAVSKGISKGVKKGGSLLKKSLVTDVTEKALGNLGPIDRTIQYATGIAKDVPGGVQFKKLTPVGVAAIGAGHMAVSTTNTLLGSGSNTSRGYTSVAQGMERFVSYDGSGFVDNIADVAGGNPEIMTDIVRHSFPSQAGAFTTDANLGDLVFALHRGREG